MSKPFTGIDHVILMANDLARSGAKLAELGFRVSPTLTHPPENGTADRLIIFQNTYLELLAVAQSVPATAPLEQFLQGGDALGAVALTTPDAKAAYDWLAANSIIAAEPMVFKQPMEDSDEILDFHIIQLPFNEKLGFLTFLCEHTQRAKTLRKEHMKHANGALDIAAIVFPANDPLSLQPELAPLFGEENITQVDDYLKVETGNAPIFLSTVARMEDHLGVKIDWSIRPPTAVSFKTASLAETNAYFERENTPLLTANDERVCVSADNGAGALIEFIEA